MNNGSTCAVLSMNLLNWGMYGPVAPVKVEKVCNVILQHAPALLCLSEVGPGDALPWLVDPLASRGLVYETLSVGKPNARGIRNAILRRPEVEVLSSRLNVPTEFTLPAITLENFEMGEMRLRLSREPLAVLVRIGGHVLAVGFFHPKSKYPEDYRTGRYPQTAKDQTFLGTCKMISSLRNFGQCLLAREFVDRFTTHNPTDEAWNCSPKDIHFALVGDWNANPQEEQRAALRGFPEAGLLADTLLADPIGTSSTDMRDICTIPWGGMWNSFDAIYVDHRLAAISDARIIPVDALDLAGLSSEDRDRVENESLDHCPVGLFLK